MGRVARRASASLRAAGRWLRDRGVLSAAASVSPERTYKFVAPAPAGGRRSREHAGDEPPFVPPAWRADAASRQLFFQTGRKGLVELAGAIESYTGVRIDGCDALDFGCGLGRFTLALAERCRRVYGVDQSPAALRVAQRNAAYMKRENIEWIHTERLAELSGRYDLVLSVDVFQHIPTRAGERTFTELLTGLRPGGVGAIELPLRPSRALAQMFRFRAGGAVNPLERARAWDASRAYMLWNSYSLNRLGGLLAAADVRAWHVRYRPSNERRAYDSATVIFAKSPQPAPTRPPGEAVADPHAPPAAPAAQA
jgi:SAM-dependent methyltransferase